MRCRKASDAKWRDKVRAEAAALSMSTKAYRASRWSSARWTYTIEVVRRRCKKSGVECTITPADLAKLWESQGGICPITGWMMGARKAAGKLTPETVTVDRIEQSVGYVPTNIRLVCFAANNARYIWDDAKLIEMCRAIIAKADQ